MSAEADFKAQIAALEAQISHLQTSLEKQQQQGRPKIAKMSAEVTDSNPYRCVRVSPRALEPRSPSEYYHGDSVLCSTLIRGSRLMALQRMHIVKEYEVWSR
jgi:hypothetical protein